MKKILLILTLLLFSSTAFAAAINKSGFVDKNLKVNKKLQVSDPSNKIIIIYNHGSNETDRKTKKCFWSKVKSFCLNEVQYIYYILYIAYTSSVFVTVVRRHNILEFLF